MCRTAMREASGRSSSPRSPGMARCAPPSLLIFCTNRSPTRASTLSNAVTMALPAAPIPISQASTTAPGRASLLRPPGSMGPVAALGRVLVVSPHLDDAVFGCGELLAACPGSIVTTVFAGAPKHSELTEWDAAAGFRAGQDVMAARREEDQQALTIVGAS